MISEVVTNLIACVFFAMCSLDMEIATAVKINHTKFRRNNVFCSAAVKVAHASV